MFEEILFYIFSAIVMGFFIIAVFSKNVLESLLSLAFGMVFLSAHYFLLGAEFLGAAQIVVYSGAVLGLFSFAIMFFDLAKPLKEKINKIQIALILAIAILLGAFLYGFKFQEKVSELAPLESLQNTQNLGVVLFTKYLLAFELIALVLLIVLVGAIFLVNKKEQK